MQANSFKYSRYCTSEYNVPVNHPELGKIYRHRSHLRSRSHSSSSSNELLHEERWKQMDASLLQLQEFNVEQRVLMQKLGNVFNSNETGINLPYTYIPEGCDWHNFFTSMFCHTYVDSNQQSQKEWSVLSHITHPGKNDRGPFGTISGSLINPSISFMCKMFIEKYNLNPLRLSDLDKRMLVDKMYTEFLTLQLQRKIQKY
jgi:hypothetical protein